MGAPVVHFEIMGGKGSELATFYSELFGWKINSNNSMKYGMIETGGGPGGINGGVGPADDGSRRVSVYAQVEDLHATLDRVEHLGGKTILPPPKYREALSWPSLPIPQAISQDFLWGSRPANDDARLERRRS
jgi:predicted enzyme related to lactoylglutathione lyase